MGVFKGCVGGMFEVFCSDLGGQHGLEQLFQKRIDKTIFDFKAFLTSVFRVMFLPVGSSHPIPPLPPEPGAG